MQESKFSDSKYFDNRELSWLKFERRVFNESLESKLPILERLKFIAITSSNLDEFFMVRVASLKDMEHAGYTKLDIAGMTPTQQLEQINERTRELVATQYDTYNKELMPLLNKKGIFVYDQYEDLTRDQLSFIDEYFMAQVYPVLTPMAHDASRPFPLIRNKSLNIAALIEKQGDNAGKASDKQVFATVQVPSVLPRYIQLPSADGQEKFVLMEQVIEHNMDKLFVNYQVVTASPYRIMRNADFSIDEEGAEDLLIEIEKQIKSRQRGEVIRLEVEDTIDDTLLQHLRENLGVSEADTYRLDGPLDLTYLFKLCGLPGHDDLRNPDFKPQNNPRIKPGENIFDEIRKGDILLHHPYETFDPVVDFIRQAAEDPQVLAIKQTLYRVSGNSPIIASLAKAADNGKAVTVLVELKARFDEENNILWAKKLEKAGCHVIYGLVGLKTHCKIALVVRREEDGIRRYVHLGTGNYNDSTAKLYTDCGMFTCRESYGQDATAVFNMLSGYCEPAVWNKLAVAPFWLRDTFITNINREIKHAKEGKEAIIIGKMNSLCDKTIIEKLYEASAAGVQIYLIVRGICCLRTDIKGVSENIHVRSIVGNYLEHARIFYFYNNGQEDMYMGSADWMPRNLDRRVEIIFPVEDEKLKVQVKHILDVQLNDNVKAYIMNPDGEYIRPKHAFKKAVYAQDTFCKEAMKRHSNDINFGEKRHFIPIMKSGDRDE